MAERLVYVRGDRSRVHVAVQHDGDMLSNEKCNLDDIEGEREVLDELPPDIDETALCHTCFPDPVEHG
jgi:hypothetical protein